MSQAQDIIEAEEYNSENQEFEDDGYSVSSTQSSLVSINSSILRGQVAEGGRTYAVYGKEEYGFPMDEQELDRMDMAHAKYFALLERKRFLAPIAKDPQKVLDLGCGTGIWSIDFADQFPSAEVIGVDIAPTQPGWVPPNCRFELDDMEQPWTWKEDSFDFIFSRDLILSVRDFPKLIDQCYTHLKPNGYVEFQSVVGLLGCDDSTVPSTSALQSLSNNLVLGCTKFGTPIDDAVRWESWFKARGFVDVTVVVKKLPCTPWPKDARMKFLGACEMENLQSSLEGLTMRLFQKALGWDQKTVDDFLVGVRGDLRKKSLHAYWPYYVVYARKPGALENGGKGVGT